MGEEGFSQGAAPLAWNDELTVEVLRTLQAPERPEPMASFAIFERFLTVFEQDPTARSAARALGIDKKARSAACAAYVHTRLYGPESAWNAVKTGDETRIVLEPMFVTIAKAVLEHASGHADLFR